MVSLFFHWSPKAAMGPRNLGLAYIGLLVTRDSNFSKHANC
jgi:hypothetical protein